MATPETLTQVERDIIAQIEVGERASDQAVLAEAQEQVALAEDAMLVEYGHKMLAVFQYENTVALKAQHAAEAQARVETLARAQAERDRRTCYFYPPEGYTAQECFDLALMVYHPCCGRTYAAHRPGAIHPRCTG